MDKSKQSRGKHKLRIAFEGRTVVKFYANEEEEKIAKGLVELVKKKFGGDVKVLRER